MWYLRMSYQEDTPQGQTRAKIKMNLSIRVLGCYKALTDFGSCFGILLSSSINVSIVGMLDVDINSKMVYFVVAGSKNRHTCLMTTLK